MKSIQFLYGFRIVLLLSLFISSVTSAHIQNAEAQNPITGFALIDADTESPVPGYENLPADAFINLSKAGYYLNIQAKTSGDVGSVIFDIDGTYFSTENMAPYALFGDWNGDYTFTETHLNIGSAHTVTARAYSQQNGGGQLLGTSSFRYYVVNNYLSGTRLYTGLSIVDDVVFYNTSSQQPINEVNITGVNSDIFQLTNTPDYDPDNVNLAVYLNSSEAQSVLYSIEGSSYVRVENVPPFALFGDMNGIYSSGRLQSGITVVNVAAYSDKNATGNLLGFEQIRISVP